MAGTFPEQSVQLVHDNGNDGIYGRHQSKDFPQLVGGDTFRNEGTTSGKHITAHQVYYVAQIRERPDAGRVRPDPDRTGRPVRQGRRRQGPDRTVRPDVPAGRSPVRPARTNPTAIEGKRLLQPRSPLGRDEGADTCPLIPQPLLDLI